MTNILSKRNWRVAAVLLCGLGVVKVIQAFNPQPDPPVFGLIGMNPGDQFMRLNVSNLPIPGILFGSSCDVELTFSDDQGRILKRSLPTLALGQSTHLDLTLADLGLGSQPPPTGDRVEILPSVVRGGTCLLTPSVEVAGTATGHTDAYVVRAGWTNHNETLVLDSKPE